MGAVWRYTPKAWNNNIIMREYLHWLNGHINGRRFQHGKTTSNLPPYRTAGGDQESLLGVQHPSINQEPREGSSP